MRDPKGDMIKKSVAERIEQVQSPVIPIVGDG